jgi:hypothetical protein
MTLVRELLEIPERIHKSDFVLMLSEGLEQPENTASSYVVTGGLVDAFDRALGSVGRSLEDGRSRAGYLHGSFGSGKSHFMALLSLLLAGNEAAWRVPELHALRSKHGFVGNKPLLQLHFHMIGMAGIEQAIFQGYLEFVGKQHAGATVPGLFADEDLFSDARRMLEELGDDAFFSPMNSSSASPWGDFDVESRWDRERFERAARSADLKEREELFSALVKTRFRAYASESRAFVDFDSGLSVMARHAADLGYAGIVLFLDELILWLAHRASEVSWLHNEVQKMVKLVESETATRRIPITSFIARQRSLVDMVGKEYAGADAARLKATLEHWEGRYDTIELEDRNLPAIVEKRVIRPKPGATQALDDAFDKLRRAAGSSWTALLGSEDASAFRKLYPFSPALVEALVALSNSLQRQRTAIRLLMEILVEHTLDLEVGEVVRVGDLFDVLAGGEEPTDGVMKARFASAKQLYRYQFLPMIQEQNETNTAVRCQRERPGHPTRLGCSNCGERQCRADNRLVKTLLVAALVPEVKPLKDLTASRLVALNHGTLKVPIAGTEAKLAADKLRRWASVIGQLHLGNQPDPTLRLQLEGVELGPILEQARSADNDGARQRVVRDLLFDALGVDKVSDWQREHKITWNETHRYGTLLFGNVRTMPDETLRCPDNEDWRLLVDYPFDVQGHGPNEDLETLERFVEGGSGSWTLAWLPHFLSPSMNDLLGELVILEHILDHREQSKRYVAHLSPENQSRALVDLENLRNQKRIRLVDALHQAYGVAAERPGDLDSGLRVEQHLVVLKAGVRVRPELAANLGDAIDCFVPALLEARFPRHPRFTEMLSKQRVERLVQRFGELVDAEDKRIPADATLVNEMRGTLGELGLVRVTEGAVHLVEDQKLQELENKRRQKAVDQPSVGELRGWIDEGGKMGLQDGALDLVARCYARATARTFVRFDKPYVPVAGTPIPNEVVLEKPDLPSHAEWAKALVLANTIFGITWAQRALHAENLRHLEASLNGKLSKSGVAAKHASLLASRASELGLGADVDRVRTARSLDAVFTLLSGKPGTEQVRRLAQFQAETSASALGACFLSLEETTKLLADNLVFGIFQQLAAERAAVPGADELLEQARQAVRQDELNLALAARLRALAEQAQGLMRPPETTDARALSIAVRERLNATGKAAALSALASAVEKLRGAIAAGTDDVTLAGELTVSDKKS